MKVLVADKLAEVGLDYLRQQPDVELLLPGDAPESSVAELVKEADGLIVRSATTVTPEMIASAPQLRAVGRAGTGVDNIDLPAATERGIVVMNTPGGNAGATAELTFTHLIASARPIAQAHLSVSAGKWEKKKFPGEELEGKTLGVLGLGRIGSRVAERAQAFGMTVLAYDPFLTDERAQQLGVEKVELEALFPRVDFLTVHMPLTDATKYMVNDAAFAAMKDGVRLVNVARGGLIEEAALIRALESGKVAAVGLDVFETEPLAEDHPLRQFPNVVFTPHLGASTVEAQEIVGLEIAKCIVDCLRDGTIRNAVNAPSVDASTLKELRPYLRLAGLLGCLAQQITPDQVRKIRLVYSGKLVDMEVRPITRAFQKGYLRKIANDVNDVNAPRVMKRLGVEGESVQTTLEREYTELIRVEATAANGQVYDFEGTLLGRSDTPRLILANGREVEAPLDERYLLVIENTDVPGIVGMLGNVLAKHQVNISNMALSRNTVGGIAFNICGIDSNPPAEVLSELRAHEAINQVHLVDLSGVG